MVAADCKKCFLRSGTCTRDIESELRDVVLKLVLTYSHCCFSTVKGQYQMTNKPPPTTPSTYVPNIIRYAYLAFNYHSWLTQNLRSLRICRPMQEFLEKWGVHFDSTKRHQLLLSIVEEVCDVYSALSSELLRSALELEESLKSRKLQRHSGSSSTLTNNSVSDTEKMRMQLLLDLEEIQRYVDILWCFCIRLQRLLLTPACEPCAIDNREAVALGLDVQHCNGLLAAIDKLSESES